MNPHKSTFKVKVKTPTFIEGIGTFPVGDYEAQLSNRFGYVTVEFDKGIAKDIRFDGGILFTSTAVHVALNVLNHDEVEPLTGKALEDAISEEYCNLTGTRWLWHDLALDTVSDAIDWYKTFTTEPCKA